MRSMAVLFLIGTLVSLGLSGCQSHDIWPDNPYNGESGPEIKSVAVAPFLVHNDIAQMTQQPFDLMSFTTSDGVEAFFSTAFAKEFADSLSEFKGLSVETPERVARAWQTTKGSAEELNPMATREQAMELARTLGVDAIIVATVQRWDPYERPSVVLHWSMYYTKGGSENARDIRRMETQGTGGTLDGTVDLDRVPIYTNQLTVDLNLKRDQDRLEDYAASTETPQPHKSMLDAITAEAYPRLVRFTAWVAMCNAYDYQHANKTGAKE